MRRALNCGALFVCAGIAGGAWGSVTSFDDIEFWIGSGVNEAVLVIDWVDGRDPLAWGYRWDGAATTEDAFFAIVTADSNLFSKVGTSGVFGVPVYGIGFDRDADGFALDDATDFGTSGLAVTDESDTAVAIDADDSYAEGFLSAGFWSFFLGDDNPYGGGSWETASTGISGNALVDGDWNGLSWAAAFAAVEPGLATAAVPSAGTGGGVLAALFMVGARRRR